jgi:hypothetical protein
MEAPKKVRKVDFISEILNGDNKIGEYFGKDVEIDHNMIHRKQVALNIPALTLLIMGSDGQYSFEDDSQQIFKESILPLYDALTKDTDDEIRGLCA